MELATAPPAMPLSISVQVLPPSWVRQKCGFMSSRRRVLAAAYAVLVSKWPAPMLNMRAPALTWGGVTLATYLPALAGTSHVWRVRSPLMGVQLCPPLVVFHTPAVPKKSTLGSLGDQMSGWVDR